MAVKPIPEGYTSVTPYLVCRDAARAIDWYKQAFGAEELFRMPSPDGKIMHAEVRVGSAIVMLTDEWPEMGAQSPETLGGSPVSLFQYAEDCDAVYKHAVENGATGLMPPADMFWGDRYGMFKDPFGHTWAVATHIEDVPPDEMERRQAEWMQKNAGQCS